MVVVALFAIIIIKAILLVLVIAIVVVVEAILSVVHVFVVVIILRVDARGCGKVGRKQGSCSSLHKRLCWLGVHHVGRR